MSPIEQIEKRNVAKWRALVALAKGVKAYRAAETAGAPMDGLHDWLEGLEADYRAAADREAAAFEAA